MPKKPITTDELARLISKGFDETRAELSDVEERIRRDMATKADLEEFATRLDLHDVEERLTAEIRKVHDLDRRFQTIEERLTQIEKRAH